MKVLVCGGRNFNDVEFIESSLWRFHNHHKIDCLIHGDCRGVDRIAGAWALSKGIAVMVFPANWDFYGNSAGPIRNKSMITYGKPEVLIAFEGGRGTEGMIKLSQSDGISLWQPAMNNPTPANS